MTENRNIAEKNIKWVKLIGGLFIKAFGIGAAIYIGDKGIDTFKIYIDNTNTNNNKNTNTNVVIINLEDYSKLANYKREADKIINNCKNSNDIKSNSKIDFKNYDIYRNEIDSLFKYKN